MSRVVPEHVASAARQSSDRLREALDEADCTQTAAGDATGRKRQHIGEMCDRDCTRSATARDLESLPVKVQRAYLRSWAESLGLIVTERGEVSEHGPDHLARLSAIAREQGELLSALAGACADGHISPAEARAVRLEAQDVIEQAISLANAMGAIERERGTVIPLPDRSA